MPYTLGLTCLMKGHGHFNPHGVFIMNARDKSTSRLDFLKELKIVNGRVVLLMRNPYHVIYSYRNYVDKGFAGHANESRFTGPGMDWLQINTNFRLQQSCTVTILPVILIMKLLFIYKRMG